MSQPENLPVLADTSAMNAASPMETPGRRKGPHVRIADATERFFADSRPFQSQGRGEFFSHAFATSSSLHAQTETYVHHSLLHEASQSAPSVTSVRSLLGSGRSILRLITKSGNTQSPAEASRSAEAILRSPRLGGDVRETSPARIKCDQSIDTFQSYCRK